MVKEEIGGGGGGRGSRETIFTIAGYKETT